MPDKFPEPKEGRAGKRARKSVKTLEFIQRLDQMAQSYPPVRLMVDMARDAGLEIFRKQEKAIRRLTRELKRQSKKRHMLHDRLVQLLHELTTGPAVLPRPTGRSPVEHDDLLRTFRRLQTQDYPALAKTMHENAGRSTASAYQRFLVDEILVGGSRVMVEFLLRRVKDPPSARDEAEFLRELRDHISGNVVKGLASKADYKVTPDMGKLCDQLIGNSLTFLAHLLTATPPGRLLIPLPGSAYSPDHHEPIPGRPTTGTLKITATMFPGYLICANPDRVEEKARVYTEYGESDAAGSGEIPMPGKERRA
jgi:hypothetical protein